MARLVDESAEWRNFADSDKDASRVGMVNEFLKDLSTDISSGTDGKMSKIQQRVSLTSANRNLLSGFDKIGHISEILSLPDKIRTKAKELFTQFEEKRKKSMRGSKTDAIVAAIIFRACKEAKVPRTFKELTRETGIDEKETRKFYRYLSRLLPQTDNPERTSAADLVSRFCSHLGLSHHITTAAIHTAQEGQRFVEGKCPSSIAAAAILLVSRLSTEKRWEKDIAAVANISPTTVRNCYRDLVAFQTKILPPSFVTTLQQQQLQQQQQHTLLPHTIPPLAAVSFVQTVPTP
jgi:transcription initiation factor TFIIB